MGTANVAFFRVPSNGVPVRNAAPISSANVTTSATSAQSAAAPCDCYVYVCSNTTERIAIGSDPTATATGVRLPADIPFDGFIVAGDKVALINE